MFMQEWLARETSTTALVLTPSCLQKKSQREYETAKQRVQTTRQGADKAQVVVALARQEAEHAAGLAAAEKARVGGTEQ
jgi:hypothetical protein